MDKIIIGFSRPKNILDLPSLLIRFVTWCPFSHTYIKYFDYYSNRSIIYQASGIKVNFIGEKLFKKNENVFIEFEVPISTQTKKKTIKFAIDKCGKPYGVVQIFGFTWVLFMKIFNKKVKNPFYDGSSYFCSELVSDILKDIIKDKDNLDPGTATPKDVYNFIKSRGYKKLSSNQTGSHKTS